MTTIRVFKFAVLSSAIAALAALGGCSDDESSPVTVSGPSCDPACNESQCQYCVIDGNQASCVSVCGDNATCQAGQCVAEEVAGCSPECDANQCSYCQDTGSGLECVSACGEGATCDSGQCVPADPAPVCDPSCAEGEACVDGECLALAGPTCEPACGACEVCDTAGDSPVCVSTCGAEELCNAAGTCVRASFHATVDGLQGPFASGEEVTTACLECHDQEAEDFKHSPHWTWVGPTPGLQGFTEASDQGKRTFVNNLCVSIPSNEKRCSQCHAGYGYENSNFDFNDKTKMDCLVCHADPASGYKKEPKTAGRPPESLDLAMVAKTVGETTVGNCGNCHFNAGGGDNVKKGDIGSALLTATPDSDVHMGSGMTCANCHAEDGHVIAGSGIHTPVSVGNFGCVDCHTDNPHDGNWSFVLNDHARDVACETCHIPAFSRQQPTKMAWDWSTAGNRTRGDNGIERTALPDGTMVTSYDAMKGDFVWEKSVKPVYRWRNASTTHLTLFTSYPSGVGTSSATPVTIAEPLATYADMDAKISPFKRMTGRQPAHLTGRYLITPKLFGPGGFWALIPSAENYDAATVAANWDAALTAGARTAGQIADTESIAAGDWGFVYTEMYLGLNHEVAPANMALGAASCDDCHSADSGFPWTELGYSCDPITGGGCGSRSLMR